MGLITKVLHFLGGKPPQVIFRDRQIFHEHTEKKWNDWKNRFRENTHQWINHAGKTWSSKKK